MSISNCLWIEQQSASMFVFPCHANIFWEQLSCSVFAWYTVVTWLTSRSTLLLNKGAYSRPYTSLLVCTVNITNINYATTHCLWWSSASVSWKMSMVCFHNSSKPGKTTNILKAVCSNRFLWILFHKSFSEIFPSGTSIGFDNSLTPNWQNTWSNED